MLRGARLVIGTQDAEAVVILMHGLDEPLGERLDRLTEFRGALDDLVVDVGDVAHEDHAMPAPREIAADDIEGDLRACMTDVAEVIDGIAADIHADLTGANRRERFTLAGQ